MNKRLMSISSAALLLFAVVCLPGSLIRAGRLTDLSSQWTKNGLDVISGFHNMYNPHIIHEPGQAYPFKMWFFGWSVADCNPGYSGCDAIFFARSVDLDNWEIYSGTGQWNSNDPNVWVPVITAQSETYDSGHNGDSSVVKRDGMYYMAYSATGTAPGPRNISCVMGASSTDGISWTKTTSPILINMDDYSAPVGQNPDYGLYHRPSIMFDEGKWKCWFDYWHPTLGVSMAYAECPDGSFMNPAAWQVMQAGETPILSNWVNPDVVKMGARYYSYADPPIYYGQGWLGRHVVEAVSNDGLNWVATGHIPPEADVPTTHVPEAFILSVDGCERIVLFYSCQAGDPSLDFRYKRIRYMWRPVYSVADHNEDCNVNLEDFGAFADHWLEGNN